MAEDTLEVHEELDFHSCNVPYGMVPFVFDDLTHDQQNELNQLKVETIRSDEIYLARHPQVRAIINIILRRVFRVRPKKDVRIFIAKYFLRSYEDIKAEVAEVMRPRKDRSHEGDSAVRLGKPEAKAKKPRSREILKKESLPTDVTAKMEPEDPESIVKAIIADMLNHLEYVCMRDMNIIFSDDEDDYISAFNYRGSEFAPPMGKSISEEVFRIETEERLARARMQDDGIMDEDAIRRYIEEGADYGEGEFYGEMMQMQEEIRESYYKPAYKPPPPQQDVYEKMDDLIYSRESELTLETPSVSVDKEYRSYIRERELGDIDYDATRSLERSFADEAAAYDAREDMSTEERQYDMETPGEGGEEQSIDQGVIEYEGEEEAPELSQEVEDDEEEEVTEITNQPDVTISAPLVVKDSAAREKDMEEYFLAPIEDTVPTYLQADDSKDQWSPTVGGVGPQGKDRTKQPVLMRKASQAAGVATAPARDYSISPGDAKGSRVQLVIDKGEVIDSKPQAWDFVADRVSTTRMRVEDAISQTKLLGTAQEKSKSITLLRTASRHERNRPNIPK